MPKVTCANCKGAGCAVCCWKGWYGELDKDPSSCVATGVRNARYTRLEVLDMMWELYINCGLTARAISKRTGVPYATVVRWVRRWRTKEAPDDNK